MEFCIMKDNYPFWRNLREPGLCRHEIFFGTGNRKLSIEDGLVVFLTPEMHNMTNQGVHFNRDFDLKLKKRASKHGLIITTRAKMISSKGTGGITFRGDAYVTAQFLSRSC